jgi:hypothetical protein
MTDARLTLVTSPDGQWAAARDATQLVLMPAAGGAATGKLELSSADVDIALVGPPTALVVLSRDPAARAITLYAPPTLEAVAGIELDADARIAAVSGPRLAILSADAKHVAIVRSAGRALATQKIEVAGPVELLVGLEKNQMLFGLPKKLEVWDAVSGRPLLRAQFQLPPPPRMLGTAAGHLWAMQVGSDELFLYRLSDGRPFRHYAGAPITDVICHPASPVLVLVTAKGLVRLHSYAHSLSQLDGTPNELGALALHVVGEDISLVGCTGIGSELWRLPINGAGAGSGTRAVVSGAATGGTAPTSEASVAPSRATPISSRWRDALATYARSLLAGDEAELPALAIDTELGELAHRLGLSVSARRALTVLYALHVIGESISIAALAKTTDDWAEPLGQGELAALAMLRRKHGKLWLRAGVSDLLDGAPPRSTRIVGRAARTPRAGAFRMARDSRTDAEIEAALVEQLGRIAVVEGRLDAGLLEARMRGATAIAYSVPPERPRPWPRDAGLVLVLYGTSSSWVADLPTLSAAAT